MELEIFPSREAVFLDLEFVNMRGFWLVLAHPRIASTKNPVGISIWVAKSPFRGMMAQNFLKPTTVSRTLKSHAATYPSLTLLP